MSTLPSLPVEFTQRLQEIIPPALLPDVLETFCTEKPTAFRVNPLVAPRDAVLPQLIDAGFHLTPVAWNPDAFLVPPDQRRALTEAPAFYAGSIYIQNLSSMLAAPALAPGADDQVLDLAAAPGGKTLQLAAMVNPEQGRLVAVEAVKGRFFRLRANLVEHGAALVESYLMDGRRAGRRWPGVFDRVLLDAPCSSEARFSRRDPQSWAHWKPRKIKEAAYKQKGLLQAALDSVRPDGLILYCTCSFAPEENEQVVDALLRRNPGRVTVEPLAAPVENVQPGLTTWGKRIYDPVVSRAVRVLPTAEMDGFFLCLLRKSATNQEPG